MNYSLAFLIVLYFLNGSFASLSAQDDPIVIARISLIGNKRTKDNIILRELTFKSGDTINASEFSSILVRNHSNLVNTLLFNYVEILPLPIDSVYYDIIVNVKERFYLWPIPVFQFADPNFNTWWLNKDFSRTNYGLVLLKKNFRGRNEDLGAKVQLGYSKEYAFAYRVPYITKKQNVGAGVWASYVQNNEITVGTKDNERIFYTGTTGNSRDELSVRLNFTIRKQLYFTHFFELRLNRNTTLDTVLQMKPDYFSNSATRMKYLSFYYTFKHDKRDNKGYPLVGTISWIELVRHGLGILKENEPNVTYITAMHNEFFQLSKHLFFATQLKAKYNFNTKLPYFFQEALGYTNFVRGYEYYVIDGQHFALFKSNVKYRLIGPKVHDIKYFEGTNFSKFHYAFFLNFYLDAGYVFDQRYYTENPLNNSLLYGSGLGLDFVTQYDKVIRFEYSLNKELEHGFFLHFIKPI